MLIGSMDDRYFGPSGAQEHRSYVSRHGEDQRAHRDFVGRREYAKAGKRTGQPQVLNAHLRWSVFAYRDAAVRTHHLQVDIRIRRGYSQLLESFVHGEAGEAGREWNLAARGHAGTDCHHVGFGNSAFHEALWKLLGEEVSVCRF